MSLAWRVSFFFLGALALVLSGFSLSLYFLAQRHLSRQVDDKLTAALDTLAAASEIQSNGVEWEPEERRLILGTGGGAEEIRWVVRDGEGRLVGCSANIDAGTPWLDEPSTPYEGEDAVRQIDHDSQPWRLARRRLSPTGTPGQDLPAERHRALVLTAGASLAPLRATLQMLAATLGGLSAGLWLAAAVAGRWACRWALAPVNRLAAAARSMNATKPGLLLPRPGTQDELEDLSRAFNDLLSRLAEAFERQQRFTGDASHQLRTPLTALLGQVEVALRRERPADEYRRVLSQVYRQADNLRRIVEALLFLARADAEAQPPGMETVDLGPWLADQVGRWGGQARDRDVRLERPANSPLLVQAQPILLGVLLDNLVDNSLKYSDVGSPVTISARQDGDAVVLTVQDAGRGIAPADLPHIFEPFYRSTEAPGLCRAGVGLGLAVVWRVATAFGGDLVAESEPGRGSRFSLRLPAAPVGAHDSSGASAN